MSDQIDEEYFKNRKEAHDWLIANNYQVSIGKFYEDIKKKGFPVIKKDKSVSKYQVLVYGQKLQEEQITDPTDLHSSEHSHKKEKADADIAQMKADRMRREEDKLWLHADDAWSALAAVVGKLRDSIRHHINLNSNEIILAAGGDQGRAAEVFETIDEYIDVAFNEVAESEIDVTWEGN